MQKFADTLGYKNSRGAIAVAPGSLLSIYIGGTGTLATLYADDQVTTIANPQTADANGLVQCKVANGTYDFVYSNGVGNVRVNGVVAYDPAGSVGAGQEVVTTVSTVVTCSTALPVDDTKPQNTEGTQVATVTIVPSSSSIGIELSFFASGSTDSGMFVGAAVFQDAGADALTGSVCQAQTTGPDQKFQLAWTFKVAAGSTASRTYKLRIGPDLSGNVYLNGDGSGNRIMGGAQALTFIAREVPA